MTRATPVPDTITLHVPFAIAKRGGRKEMILPPNAPVQRSRVDNTLVKALARAFRWKRMLESGEYATIAELAEREGIAPSYMTRVLRMTLLAPDTVEAILDGRQAAGLTLKVMLQPFPSHWPDQGERFVSVAEVHGETEKHRRRAEVQQTGNHHSGIVLR